MVKTSKYECQGSSGCYFLQECIKGFCHHIHPLPGTVFAWFVYLLIPILVGTAITGGLGGGIIKSPVLELMLNYTQEESTFIAYGIMFGGCLGNMIILQAKRSPIADKPLISFPVSMIFNSTLQLGDNIGVIMAVVLPPFIQSIFFEIFLILVIPYLLIKYNKARKLEQQVQQEPQKETELQNHEKLGDNNGESENLLALNKIREYEKQKIYPYECLFILGSIVFTMLILFMRASKNQHSIIDLRPCVWQDNLVLVAVFIFTLIWSTLVYKYASKQAQLREAAGYEYSEGDYMFTNKFFFSIWTGGFFAGIISGVLGLGAGLIMVPTMLFIGLNPRIVAATSSFNYFCISITCLVNIFVQNLLPYYTTVWYLFLSFLGGSFVSYPLYNFVEKHKLNSLMILIVLVMAVLNMIANVFYVYLQNKRYGFEIQMKGQSFC